MQSIVKNTEAIYGSYSLQGRKYFLHTFEKVPSVIWMNQIDVEKALRFLRQQYESKLKGIHEVSEYDHQRKKIVVSDAMVVFENECMIELSGSYCEILYIEDQKDLAIQLIHEIKRFKESSKRSGFEINIIVNGESGLELKSMDVKKTRLNLDLYYEESFKEVDELLQKRLNTPKDKGIVLLHGLPGTGKTTYLRYLIGKLRKKIIFVSPDAARHISSPQLLDLLIDNPECILIIEDAEGVIQDRQLGQDSSVSSLLNISDGLLADFLNIQIICTFNQSLAKIDEALLRKGRLITKYEFGRLSVAKGQKLANALGFDKVINQPMTIAEITNANVKDIESDNNYKSVGFQFVKISP
jgi:SpoVK/Ycf46/Vps4 family AAA+-type ATPase